MIDTSSKVLCLESQRYTTIIITLKNCLFLLSLCSIRNVVYRSEHINNNLNPYWEPFQLTLEELCYADLDWPLRITVCDWDGVAATRRLGYFETTLKGLHQQIAVRGNADRERAFDLDTEDKGTNLGLICVVACELQSYEGEEILIEQTMKNSLTSSNTKGAIPS